MINDYGEALEEQRAIEERVKNRLKRYEIDYPAMKRRALLCASSPEEACKKAGWNFEDCTIKEVKGV